MSQKICTPSSREWVLKFLQKVQVEHQKQISSLQSRIKELQNLKQSISKQLHQAQQSLKLSQQTIQKLQLQLKICSQEITQNSTKSYTQQNEQDRMIKYLADAPHQILKVAQSIQPSPMRVSQKDVENCRGKIECIVWSKDQHSLERYQKINRHYISGLLKGQQKSKVQMMMVYNHA